MDIAGFIHAQGSFNFEKGPQQLVTLGSGLPKGLAATAAGEGIHDIFGTLLEAGTGAQLSENLGTITGWDVAVSYFGASDINVFVGYGSPDFDQDKWSETSGLFGFAFEGVDFAYANMQTTLPAVLKAPFLGALDSFYAAKLNAESAAFVGGGEILNVEAKNLELRLNDNDTNWFAGTPLQMGRAVIDWAASFPADDEAGTAAGLGIKTGAYLKSEDEDTSGYTLEDGDLGYYTDSLGQRVNAQGFLLDDLGERIDQLITLDFGSKLFGLSVEDMRMDIAGFIHAQGSFNFEKGPQQLVTLGTGLPQGLASTAAGEAVHDIFGTLLEAGTGAQLSENLGTITDWAVAVSYFGASDVDVFVGYGSPDFDADKWSETSGLFGFAFEGVDFAYANMQTTLPAVLKAPFLGALDGFYAAKLNAQSAAFVGG
ncbi:hypothetical protein, partial [Limnohabitans sp. Bal53]|uniref:hypothetical protein n=1 Tax=Limnohabitans sp. Bal53 TaxID=1977910 RepID=UPI0011B24B33